MQIQKEIIPIVQKGKNSAIFNDTVIHCISSDLLQPILVSALNFCILFYFFLLGVSIYDSILFNIWVKGFSIPQGFSSPFYTLGRAQSLLLKVLQ
jgi:hypothetical protein